MVSVRGGDRVGTMFGPYELQSLIGVGGMGEVYRAYDTVKGRTVALKLLLPELAVDAGYQQRFRRESQVAARLQEPHVVPVHDWGDIDGLLYIDMRLVEGANLKSVLAESGPLDPARAISIIAQVADALDAAHADGLVHRDIKPENILLTRSDFVYLVDFGIAHQGGEGGLTRTGAAIGSGTYMAPERFRTGGRVGPQSDVYSMACVLYECLTGQPPFRASELSQLMSAHMFAEPPRPSAARPGLSRAFDDVIARGMAKDPAGRFASAGELARAASAAAAARPEPTRTRQFPAAAPYVEQHRPSMPVQPRRGGGTWRWLVVGAAAGLLLAALVGSLWSMFGSNETRAPSSPQAAPHATTTESSAPTSEPSSTTSEPSTTSRTSASAPPGAMAGTDAQGFVNNPAARCDSGNSAAAMARTTKSLLVVCQAGPNTYYYRGTRLSDGASIELSNAMRSPSGWDVTNPADGTVYDIRPDQLTISRGQVSEVEPMVQYASR